MDEPTVERGRVTPLELFFDLVFVFAITQVTSFLSSNPHWSGMLKALLLLSILWWMWSAYAWLTNTLDPEEGGVRLFMLAAVAAMLIVSLAAPRAFGRDGVTFAVAYAVARALHLVLFTIAGRDDDGLLHAVRRLVPVAAVAVTLLLIAGFLDGSAQLACWGGAAAVSYVAPLLSHMRGFHVSPEHFAERFGQIIMIALGESIVAIGVGAKGFPLDAGLVSAALLGMVVVACLWWSYFDWLIYVLARWLSEQEPTRRAALARDAYSYLHLPMVAGIVLFSFGLKTTLPDVGAALPTVPAIGLVGGIALYLLAHVALRLRLSGGLGRGRPVAAVVLVALLPVARVIAGVAAVGLVAAVCVGLITYEFLRHRDDRARIRSGRNAFTA
jgi:low temperature requirement protein LtrA